jgi:segregation and condensation protein B
MAFNLKRVLKALLLSSSQPLAFREIQAAFARFHEPASRAPAPEIAGGAAAAPDAPGGPLAEAGEPAEIAVESEADPDLYQDVPSLVTTARIREAMDEIASDLRLSDEGLLLIEGADGYRLVTHPRFGRWVRILREEPPPVKLSQSSLETLAVVAYRQPVTRSEIETIRGVSAEAGVTKLLERELIAITGRAELPGRPLQYGTTDQFLQFVGIKSIDDLPASDVLSTRQIDEWLKNATQPQTPRDSDMGLADEELPLGVDGAAH